MLLVAASLGVGCGRSSATATVVYPAQMPVRVYPLVLVAYGPEVSGSLVAERVEAHLRQPVSASSAPAVDARATPRAQVEALIRSGALRTGTAVLDVQTVAAVRVSTVPQTRSYQDCSFGRCITRTQTFYVDQAITTLRVSMSVRDIRSGAVLHTLTESAELQGSGARATRQLVNRVMRALLPALDTRTERVRLRLLSVGDDPQVSRAIELMRAGQWREARVLLEAAVRSPEMHARDAETRARALYDLSVARRFDPTHMSDTARHFQAAKAPLRAALELDPDNTFYADAMRSIEADEARAQALAAQQEVRESNASATPELPSALPTPGGPGGPGGPASDGGVYVPPGYRN